MGILTTDINKMSAWKFVTFGSGGLSVGLIAGEAGTIILTDLSGTNQTFYYGGVGAGLSAGLKIPKIGKVQIPTPKGPLTGSGGPTAFPSAGTVFTCSSLPGGDLTKSDIQGPCMFCEVGGGIIAGASAVGMYIGLNPLLIPFALSMPSIGVQLLLNSANGLIVMAGANVGIQAQIGAAGYFGYLG